MWLKLDRLLALAVLCSTCEAKEYLGCYGDDRGGRVFPTWAGGSYSRTVDNCISRCQNIYKDTYAGLQNGRGCWCGNDHQEYKKYGESRNCNSQCPGDESQICGGEEANSVYAVCPRGYYRKGTSDNCDARCHCRDDVICQYEDGRCPNGACAEGWTGSACQYRDCNVNKGGCQYECEPQKVTNWCSCQKGYEVSEDDFTQCTDVDECETGLVDCGRLTCVNTHGSYACTAQCPEGYIQPLLTQTCVDRNECDSEDENNCQQRCENVDGSYRCTCHTGYKLKSDGFGCDDIDECMEIDIDASCHQCKNTKGSYTCLCNHGYRHSMDLTRCEDIDECTQKTDRCEGLCENTEGSYTCQCRHGFQLEDLYKCVDVDECRDQNGGCNQTCENTVGSYQCLCRSGFQKAVDEFQCKDVDECLLDNGGCSNTCINTPGSFHCTCPPGYAVDTVDGKSCVECSVGEFGVECKERCHCEDRLPCDSVNGTCRSPGCLRGYTGSSCSLAVGPSTGTIVGCVIAAVLIAVIGVGVVLLVMMWRKRRAALTGDKSFKLFHIRIEPRTSDRASKASMITRSSNIRLPNEMVPVSVNGVQKQRPGSPSDHAETTELCTNGDDGNSDYVYSPSAKSEDDEPFPIYSNETFSKFIKVQDLENFVNAFQKDKGKIKKEFESIPSQTAPCTEGVQPALKKKNRFRNIVPYDHNRVKLQDIEQTDLLSDYINASCVSGYYDGDMYIASQGPRVETVRDFWQMIWEQKIHLIVMLNNLIENGKRKCEKYWSDVGPRQFGQISVTMEEETVWLNYIKRQFTISNSSTDQPGHCVTQYHFTSWPDLSVPRSPLVLLRFRRKVRACMSQMESPVLVHCSAGVGRTGTYLALDWLLCQVEEKGGVDIYNCVQSLREQRMNLVQSLEQYLFLHMALCQAVMLGDTAIPTEKISELYAMLGQETSTSEQTVLDQQFHKLQELCPPLPESATLAAKLEVNKAKNRYNILPCEGNRVVIASLYSGRNDYINAVVVDSNRQHNHFIATQWPLTDTEVDFWRMVAHYKVSNIIVLDNTRDQQGIPGFVPTTGNKMEFHNVQVRTNGREAHDHVTLYDVTVGHPETADDESVYMNTANDSERKSIRVLQVTNASSQRARQMSLDTVLAVQEHLVRQDQKSHSIDVVVCRDGASLSGQYIASSILLDMVDAEGEMDVFYAVWLVKCARPEFIDSKQQYMHLHQLAMEYMDSKRVYAN